MHNIAIVEDNDNDAKLLESFIAQISEKEKTSDTVSNKEIEHIE